MNLPSNDLERINKIGDHRPWGNYVVLADEPTYKVKRITVYPEKRLSLQRHQQRVEHWYVVDGQALFTLDQNKTPLVSGDAVNIPARAAHRIENNGPTDLIFIEIQTGSYFGEDDIERLEDDFGRT